MLQGPFAASDEIEFAYVDLLEPDDETNSLPFKAVAIGQMPQGCEITVDADSPRVNIPV